MASGDLGGSRQGVRPLDRRAYCWKREVAPTSIEPPVTGLLFFCFLVRSSPLPARFQRSSSGFEPSLVRQP